MRTITLAQRRARIAVRHHLARPAHTVEEVAAALVELHSSDPATVYLSVWARLDGFAVADLERALYEDRSLVRILGNRRTLFVVPRDLAAVVVGACAETLTAQERRRLVGTRCPPFSLAGPHAGVCAASPSEGLRSRSGR